MEYNHKREYAHKEDGAIGTITLKAEVSLFQINGKDVPSHSVEQLLWHALQKWQDTYGGADLKIAERKERFDALTEKVLSGTMGERGASAGDSPETLVARDLVRKAYLAGASKTQKAEYRDMSAAEKAAKLDAIIKKLRAKDEAKFAKSVADEIARRAASRKAALALDVEL